MDLRTAEYHWMLNLLRPEDLPEIATEALANDVESESLLKLACSYPTDYPEDLIRLFKKVLSEVGLGTMSEVDAVRSYAREISTAILDATLSPLEGARRIWHATRRAKIENFHEMDEFIYSASEMEDRPEDKDFFENAIRELAKGWLW